MRTVLHVRPHIYPPIVRKPWISNKSLCLQSSRYILKTLARSEYTYTVQISGYLLYQIDKKHNKVIQQKKGKNGMAYGKEHSNQVRITLHLQQNLYQISSKLVERFRILKPVQVS